MGWRSPNWGALQLTPAAPSLEFRPTEDASDRNNRIAWGGWSLVRDFALYPPFFGLHEKPAISAGFSMIAGELCKNRGQTIVRTRGMTISASSAASRRRPTGIA